MLLLAWQTQNGHGSYAAPCAPVSCKVVQPQLMFCLHTCIVCLTDGMPCRYQSPIGVGELMHFFDATHTSINALPALASENVQQPTAKRIKKNQTKLEQPPPSQTANSEVTHFGPSA